MFLLFLTLYVIKNHDLRSSQFYGFALILGGGLGNFYDRIFRDGAVVDFLNIGFGSFLRTAIFNVADIAITCGLVLLVIPFIVVIPGILAFNLFNADLKDDAVNRNALLLSEHSPILYATLSPGMKPDDIDRNKKIRAYFLV